MSDMYGNWMSEIRKVTAFLRWAEIQLYEEGVIPADVSLQLSSITESIDRLLIESQAIPFSEERERGIISNLMEIYRNQFPAQIKTIIENIPELKTARLILDPPTFGPDWSFQPLWDGKKTQINHASLNIYLEAASHQEKTKSRYANHFLIKSDDETELPHDIPIGLGDLIRLRIDIGALKDTATEEDIPIPEDLLPEGPIDLEIMLSSNDFAVSTKEDFDPQSNLKVALGKMTLPEDGEAAKTPDGSEYLFFYLKAPADSQQARARIGYYFQNHLIQSFLLRASVGEEEGGYSFLVDYTLSENFSDLASLEKLPKRDHMSIFTNDNQDGEHTLVVKAANGQAEDTPDVCTYLLKETAINKIVETLRDTLYDDIKYSKGDLNGRGEKKLMEDLKKLAEIGWDLFSTVASDCMRTWFLRDKVSDEILIDVTRPNEHTYSFPWQFFYDLPLIEDGERNFCKVIFELDDVISKDPSIHRCPHEKEHKFGTTLCPFGFWGFRYKIQQHAGKGKGAYLKILSNGGPEMLVASTVDVKSKLDLNDHIKSLETTLESKAGKITNKKGKTEIMESMGNPKLPLIYYYCHGFRETGYETTTYLSVGDGEKITVNDFKAYYYSWYSQYGLDEYKKKTKSLVFINACHSIEINPDTLGSFLESFIGTEFASGIIGTEVSVDQTLAMNFAEKFFTGFVKEGKSVGEAIHQARMANLAKQNLFGLVYTPYCFADLRL